MSVSGHIIGGPADPDYDGAVLTADLAVGDSVLHVNDTADFDEDAAERDAVLLVGVELDADGNLDTTTGTAVAYKTAYDENGIATYGTPQTEHLGTPNTVELISTSAIAASSGDRVYIQDPVSGDPQGRIEVQVALDNADTSGDALPAYIDVALLESVGDVDLNDLAVDLDEDEDGQLYVSGFPGLVRSQGRIRGKATDTHAVTILGDQTMLLTYRPLPETEHLRVKGGAPQMWAAFDRDQWTVTIPDPDGALHVGDVLTMQYLYTDPSPRPLVPGSALFIGSTTAAPGDTSIALPDGTEAGDLLLLAMGTGTLAGVDPTCSDTRISVQNAGPYLLVGCGRAGSSTDPVAISLTDGEGNGGALLSAYRTTGAIATVASTGTTTIDPTMPDGSPVVSLMVFASNGDPGGGGSGPDTPQGDWTRDVVNSTSSTGQSTWQAPGDPALVVSPAGLHNWRAIVVGVSDG